MLVFDAGERKPDDELQHLCLKDNGLDENKKTLIHSIMLKHDTKRAFNKNLGEARK